MAQYQKMIKNKMVQYQNQTKPSQEKKATNSANEQSYKNYEQNTSKLNSAYKNDYTP